MQQLNVQLVLDRCEENLIFAGFYNDAERYALQTPMFFLLSRHREQHELLQLDLFHQLVNDDYTFDKDRIFAC